MVKIEVNGEFLDLPGNIRPTWKAFSPLFQNDGVISDDYSLPIDAPHTDHNARLLGYPGEIANKNSFRPRFTANLYFRGMPRIKGEVRIQDVSKATISLYFTSGLSEIAVDIRERSIRDIMDEQIVIHNTNFNKEIRLQYLGPGSDYPGLIVNGRTYKEEDLDDLVDAINNDSEQTATAAKESATFVRITPASANELEPFEVGIPIIEPDETTGELEKTLWRVDDVPFQSSYISTYRDFVNDYRGSTPERKFRFLEFYNIHNFDDDGNIKQFPAVNLYQSGELAQNLLFQPTSTRNNIGVPRTINRTSLSPQVMLAYVLEKIEDYYDIKIKFPLIDDQPFASLVILSPNTLDVPLKYFNGQRLIFYRRNFNISEFVPDMPVNEFLKSLQGLGYYITYDNTTRTVTFRNRNNVVKSPDYIDIKGLYGELFQITNPRKEGVRLTHETNPDDDYIRKFPQEGEQTFVFGAGEREISSRVSVPALEIVRPYPNPAGVNTRVVVDMAQKADFKTLTFALQSGTNDDMEISFLDPSGFSLKWKETLGLDELGLFDQLWDNWIVLEDNPTSAKVKMWLPDEWVWNPIWTAKFFMHQNKFLIKSIEVTLEESELMEVEAEVVRVPYSVRTFGNTGGPIQDVDPNPLS
jgi:hypothetical protein